jgi:hypothetical protein
MPEGAHPLPGLRKGWSGVTPVELDGKNWPLDIAARLLDVPEKDLRKLVRQHGLQPAGTANMRPFRGSGRAARVYPAHDLIRITEDYFPETADRI